MNEIWKDVPGFEGLYLVSDHGNVRSAATTGLVLRPGRSSNGYMTVTLYRPYQKARSWLVQDLVLSAFVGPKPPGLRSLHRDDCKTNNRLSNLRYDTQAENMLDIGRNGNRTLAPSAVRAIRERRAAGEPGTTIAAAFGIERAQVYAIAKRTQYSHVA